MFIACHFQTVQNRRRFASVSWLIQYRTDRYSDKVHYSIFVTKVRSKQRWGADPVLGQVSWMPHLPAGTPLSSMTLLWDPLSHSCVYSVYQLDCVALCCDSNVLKPAGLRASRYSCNNDTRENNVLLLMLLCDGEVLCKPLETTCQFCSWCCYVMERFCVSLWKPRVSSWPKKLDVFAECFLHFHSLSRHIIHSSPNFAW